MAANTNQIRYAVVQSQQPISEKSVNSKNFNREKVDPLLTDRAFAFHDIKSHATKSQQIRLSNLTHIFDQLKGRLQSEDGKAKSAISSSIILHDNVVPFIKNRDLLENLYGTAHRCNSVVEDFNIDQPHYMDLQSYISFRLSSTLVSMLGRPDTKVDIFLGSSNHLIEFYALKGYDHVGEISSKTSTLFHIFQNEKDQKLIVCSNIGSEARVEHQSIQLKVAGLPLSKLSVRGSLAYTLASALRDLKADLNALSNTGVLQKDTVCFIGDRKRVLSFYNDNSDSDSLVKKSAGPFTYSVTNNTANNRSYLGLRMPNGDLAYHAVKTLLELGNDKLMMVGAGGSFPDTENPIGRYQLITKASLNGDTISLPHQVIRTSPGCPLIEMGAVKPWITGKCSHISPRLGTNVTVSSPLVENKQWYSHHVTQGFSSVDVETAHIFRAINDFMAINSSASDKLSITPGIFTSDVLLSHPLDEKINPENATRNMKHVMDVLFDYDQQTQNHGKYSNI